MVALLVIYLERPLRMYVLPLPLQTMYTPRESFTVAKLTIDSLNAIKFEPSDSYSKLIVSIENLLIVVLLSVSCKIDFPGMTNA